MKKQLFILFMTLVWASMLSAQPQRFQFDHITASDGLPENSALSLLQDHLGFLWIGTMMGLVRYDGYTMTYYTLKDSTQAENIMVIDLIEDDTGDLWIGTTLGLKHFDRATERVTTVRQQDGRETPLSDHQVLLLHKDSRGSLWILTADSGEQQPFRIVEEGFLHRLDPGTGTLVSYRHDPNDPNSLGHDLVLGSSVGSVEFYAVFEDSRGWMWFGTKGGGLNRYDPDTDSFTRYRHEQGNPASLSHDHVTSIGEDASGRLWIGTDGGGLNRLDVETGVFTRYRYDPDDPSSLDDDRVIRVFADREDELWITTNGGLSRLTRGEGERSGIGLAKFLSIPLPGASQDAENVAAAWLEESGGDLWFAYGSSSPDYHYLTSVYHYNRKLDLFTHYDEDQADLGSLKKGPGLQSILEDRSGVLWFGAVNSGLNKLAPSTQKFRVFSHDPGDASSLAANTVESFLEDRSGVLWVGTPGGLDRYDPATETFTHFRHDEQVGSSLSVDWITEIEEDHEGRLWVGGWLLGLSRLNEDGRGFTHFQHRAGDPGSIRDNRVRKVYEAPSEPGILWIGTDSGLDRFDTRTGRVTAHWSHEQNNPNSLGDDVINVIYEPPSTPGVFWIGLDHPGPGTARFDRSMNRFDHYRNLTASAIQEDSAGRLWMASAFGGLVRLDRTTGRAERYTTEDGLRSNRLMGMEIDHHGHVWFSSEYGLAYFDPESEQLRTYDTADGLPDNLFRYNSSYRGRSGNLYFGTYKGFIMVDPDEVEAADNPFSPQVVLTHFKLGEDAVSIGPDSPLQHHISVASTLELRHWENDFTITYASLDYSRPEKNLYKYKLEPYDAEWREVGTRREASYMNLGHGEYTFRVKGTNNDGVWNEEGASLRLTILPPWWRTTWAYALYALLLAGMAIGAFRLQRRRLLGKAEIEQARLRAEAAEVQAQAAERDARRGRELETAYHTLKTTQSQLVQSEKMASLGQLTSGIAHELKNPLNFVTNFAEVNEELSGELKELIRENREQCIADVQEDLDDLASGLRLNSRHIVQHGKRADAIVKSMMEHAHDASGERYDVGVNKLVEEYTKLAYHGMQAQEPGLDVKLERHLDASVGNVEMAPQEIGRALQSILYNAFEVVHRRAQTGENAYAPVVKVTTQQVDGQVEIRVCDNGPGIPPDILDHIFEPFFTTKPTGGGNTGLGLSLAYDIVTQGHGGTLTVESEEGQGATFIITLPGETS